MQHLEANRPEVGRDSIESWPKDQLEWLECCPVCGSSDRAVIYRALTDQVFFCAPGEWTLYQCGKCGSGYLDPRPTPESIGKAYRNYYTHDACEQSGVEDLDFAGRLRRLLANGYRNFRYGTQHHHASLLGAFGVYLLPVHRRVIDREMRHLPRPEPGSRLLDVGCGGGKFLARAYDAGWRGIGLDPDPIAVEQAQARGLDVRRGGVEKLEGIESSFFDVITLGHVIEHVHRPIDLLRSCYRLLKSGGRLWLETPNLNSVGHSIFGSSWRGLEPPRHLVLFTYASMRNLLCRVGFRDIESQPVSNLRILSDLYGMSGAIKDGKAPYDNRFGASTVVGKMSVGVLSLIEWSKPANREFVTYTARK